MIRSARWRLLGLLVASSLALGLAACGDESGSAPGASSEQSASTSDAPDQPAVGDDSSLVVPLDYLQGEWCNSDGEAWLFEGETARFGETHDELLGELPVAVALAAGSERVLVSQSDDEFVLDLQTRELTFTRGRC